LGNAVARKGMVAVIEFIWKGGYQLSDGKVRMSEENRYDDFFVLFDGLDI
jgi:hypothetical protein